MLGQELTSWNLESNILDQELMNWNLESNILGQELTNWRVTFQAGLLRPNLIKSQNFSNL